MKTTWCVAAIVALVLGLLAPVAQADELWLVDFKAAKEQAAKEGKDILMEFTGSDWCPPCMALHKNVLSKDVFREKTPEKYVLLKLDSPRDKSKQTPEEIEQYKELSAQYKISGVPTIILADAKGRPFSKNVGYSGAEADEYVKDLVSKAALRVTRDEQFAKAEKAKGPAKAKLLGEAIAAIDGDLVVATYRETVDEIVALDADNKLGLKEKFTGLIQSAKVKEALQDLQKSARGVEPAELVKRIDDLIDKLAPTGAGLQEALFMKGSVLFNVDKAKSKAALLAAAKAAPDTDMGKQLPQIIAANFKDDEKPEEEKPEEKKPDEKKPDVKKPAPKK